MSRRLLFTLLPLPLLLLALLLAFLVYDPVPDLDVHLSALPPVPLGPAHLERWLAQQESRFDDITPGAEKRVFWAKPGAPERTPLSLVYLHGYSATRQEVSPLFENVASALGANAFFTRLRGHGRSGEAFAQATVEQWIDDGLESLSVGQAIGERTILAGTSTGATLACLLAVMGADIDALVMVSPNFAPRQSSARMLLWPGRKLLLRLVVGEYRQWEPANELQARYWTHRYPARALFPMMELVALLERSDLRNLRVPTLLLYCPHDQVVNGDLVPTRFAELGSDDKQLIEVLDSTDPSQHVLAGRILSPNTTGRLTAQIVDFLQGAL